MTIDIDNLSLGGQQLARSPLLLQLAPELSDCIPAARRDVSERRAPLIARYTKALREGLLRHRLELAWLLPLLGVAAVVHGWNMTRAPGPNDDEGTYVSQAWAFQTHGKLSHYTYWYDHPPLGWILLSIWNALRFDIARGNDLWISGRQAMLAVHLASCVLLYMLGRRLRMPRWVAAVAVLLFTLSPLGLAWQRLTLLDNIGTPLIIGAWVLALTPRRRLAAFAGSGCLVACAVLVKETNALFLPAIAIQLWVAAKGPSRRFAVSLFAGGFAGLLVLYPLYAILKNELIPGPGHVSLLWALKWQLFSRPGSGSPFAAGTGTNLALRDWMHHDGLLLSSAVLALPLMTRRRLVWPLAGVVTLLLAMPLRGGYLPGPYPINLIWPCALLAAAGLHALSWRALAHRSRLVRSATAGLVIAALGITGIHALRADRSYLSADDTREYRQAVSWLTAHTQRSDVMLVDNTLWIELVQRGFPTRNVIWFYKFDLDPAVQAEHPGGWRAVDYIVESSIIGATDSSLPQTSAAIAHGTVVAQFGDIHVYRLPPRGQRGEGH